MDVKEFLDIIGAEFYAGVPDSQLKALCNYLMTTYGVGNKHVIAANEGNAAALAAGYHLATGKVPLVYLQNSGEGNTINPVASLMNEKVYGIPCVFVIGWRGEPGVHDEPQHIFQGEATLALLRDMNIDYMIIGQETTSAEVSEKMSAFREQLSAGKQVAFVIRKEALSFSGKIKYKNEWPLKREEIIREITAVSGDDLIVSTTGKASRELFELREAAGEGHDRDFLTVGSMGHSSSIALGIALAKPERKIWIIDGDGAALMHLGAMAVIGANVPKKLVHVVINNGAHESVGGLPTVAADTDLVKIALACGYKNAVSVADIAALQKALSEAKNKDELSFIEVKSAIGARDDLGRPTTSAKENKQSFMKNIEALEQV